MINVIIGIGYDGSDDPGLFRNQVRRVIQRLGTMSAVIDGHSWSPEWGGEDGAWFAAEFPDVLTYVEARARILAIAATHDQDAVAFTIGQTEVATCPRA